MQRLNYPLVGTKPPLLRNGCRLGLYVARTLAINASVRPGARSPCVFYTLVVTEGAVRLSVPQLRAVLAHELGHVHARREREPESGPPSTWLFRQRYNREEELAADDFAVKLLRSLDPDYPGSCMALVSLLEALAQRGGYGVQWLSTHPDPERRAKRAEAGCKQQAGLFAGSAPKRGGVEAQFTSGN
jgi:Zn-dependent protease with chaperone function